MTKPAIVFDATGTDKIEIQRNATGCIIDVSFRIFNYGDVSLFTDDQLIEKAKQIFSINKRITNLS